MCVCKSCDRALNSQEMGERVVELEDGSTIKVQEDLCKPCRNQVFVYYDDDDLDEVADILYDLPIIDWEKDR